MVVGEQAAVDFERLLEQRLGLSVFPPGQEGFGVVIRGLGRLVGDAIRLRHWGHPTQPFEQPLRVDGLEVRRTLNLRPQGTQFLGLPNRLVPAIGLQCRFDGLVQLLGPPGVLAGQLAQSRGQGLIWLWRRGLGCRGHSQRRDSEPDQQPQPEHDAKSFHDGLLPMLGIQ